MFLTLNFAEQVIAFLVHLRVVSAIRGAVIIVHLVVIYVVGVVEG